jgi:hypothetical protein
MTANAVLLVYQSAASSIRGCKDVAYTRTSCRASISSQTRHRRNGAPGSATTSFSALRASPSIRGISGASCLVCFKAQREESEWEC